MSDKTYKIVGYVGGKDEYTTSDMLNFPELPSLEMLPLEDKGRKYDEGKLQYELIPPEALEELAKVLTFGAAKYDERNWEKGMAWGRVYGALQRHLNAWLGGHLKDPETGYSHLSHALCCLVFLSVYERRGIGENNLHV